MQLAGCRVGVVGGGIGGLATALALRGLGADVIVLERARRPHQGVGLLVWGNAMKALSTIGVADDVLRVASVIDVTRVRNPEGALIAELPIGEWSQRATMPSVAVRRADLLAALAGHVPASVVREAEVTGFHQRGDRVTAQLADGSALDVDLLIGADGLHSTVRAQLHGASPPRALGQQAWVGLAKGVALEPGVATASVGRGPRFWCAPLRDGAFWYATLNELTETRTALERAFAGWHAPIGELIANTADEDLVSTQIRDRVPLTKWGAGRVTLLGDAAHASTPDLGQGACQAIESASVLAQCLERAGDVEEGLAAYERARIERTSTISRLCWLTAVNSTIESPLLCAVRDAAMRIGLRAVARSHLEWILAGPAC